MNTVQKFIAEGIHIGAEEFIVFLADSECLHIPYAAFPLLAKATPEQRHNVEIYANGKMLHWPNIDEDIEIRHLIEKKRPVKVPESTILSRTC